MSELQTTPDCSKDWGKDEREAMERLARGRDMNQQAWIASGWSGASHFFGPRLQQVEAERDGLIRQSEKTEEYLGGKLQAAEDQGCRLADELSIAREALERLRESHRVEKGTRYGSPGFDIADEALARLQAKEEGT